MRFANNVPKSTPATRQKSHADEAYLKALEYYSERAYGPELKIICRELATSERRRIDSSS